MEKFFLPKLPQKRIPESVKNDCDKADDPLDQRLEKVAAEQELHEKIKEELVDGRKKLGELTSEEIERRTNETTVIDETSDEKIARVEKEIELERNKDKETKAKQAAIRERLAKSDALRERYKKINN